MPILAQQPDIFPETLLSEEFLNEQQEAYWLIATTKPRAEKKLLTWLQQLQVPHYCPLICKRYRSPNGRVRRSYIPLFHNYVFMYGSDDQRYQALTTNQICRVENVIDDELLVRELRQIQAAVETGTPLTPEGKLEKGQRVLVRTGPFQGFEGQVIRREGKTRLLLTVSFLESGVSMEMDECQLTPL